ncbi:MAG: endo-1,4-beta-xylanase, partial [Verrucomicrobia bacterium]|nr:endo-1,4-beta-xylanase [Verrucomicrobiota bacterium]
MAFGVFLASAFAGNVLPNASFELGLAHWTWQVTDADAFASRPQVEWEESPPDVQEAGGFHGRRCVRVALDERQQLTLRSQWQRLPADQARTFSIHLHAAPQPKTATAPLIEMAIESAQAPANAARGRVRPTANWQRHLLTQPARKARAGETEPVRVALRLRGPQTLWLDAAQLETGVVASGFAPRLPAEVAVTVARRDHWFVAPESPTLVVAVANYDTRRPKSLWEVRLTGRNLDDRQLYQHELAVDTATNIFAVATTGFPGSELGHFTITAELKAVGARDETGLSLVRAIAARPPARASQFGAALPCRREHLDLAARLGARWVRMPLLTQWFVVEPKSDQWQWHDEIVRAAWRRGCEVLGSLDASAHWENGPQDRGARPVEWDNYVRQTVGHYQSLIHAWEVWNEPDQPSLLAGRDTQERLKNYTDLLRRTFATAKEVDPNCVIVGGSLGDPARATELFELGALEAMDVLSLHARPAVRGDDFGFKQPLPEIVTALKRAMRARGAEKPIWITSSAWRVASGYPRQAASQPGAGPLFAPRAAVAVLVRQYAQAMAAGVEKLFCDFARPLGESENDCRAGFVECDNSPTAMAAAYYIVSGLLDGATFLARRDPHPNARVLEFSRF